MREAFESPGAPAGASVVGGGAAESTPGRASTAAGSVLADPTEMERIAAYAEETAAVLAAAGFPRMPARVLMALMVSDSGRLTAEELTVALGASAAAISGAVRYLETINILRRHSVPGTRKHLYALPEHAWYAASADRDGLYLHLEALAEGALDLLPHDSPVAARVDEMRGFYAFMRERMPALLEEWRASRL